MRYVGMKKGANAVILENDYGINRDRVLRELAAVAFLDPARLYDDNGTEMPFSSRGNTEYSVMYSLAMLVPQCG